MKTPHEMKPTQDTTPDAGHYHTAGQALAVVGVINLGISAVALLKGQNNTFISYETMLTFAVAMIALGGWMMSLKDA